MVGSRRTFAPSRRDSRRVTHVTSRYPPDLGGMERVVKELSEALAEEIDLSVEVVTGASGRIRGTAYEGQVVVRRLRAFNLSVTPIIPGLMWDLLRRPRPLLLHVHVALAGIPEIVRVGCASYTGTLCRARAHRRDAYDVAWDFFGCLPKIPTSPSASAGRSGCRPD